MVWHGMAWYGMVWHGMAWHGMVRYGMAWHGMAWFGTVRYGTVWYSMVWYGMVWYGMVWYGMVCTYACTHVCMYLYIYLCMHACMQLYWGTQSLDICYRMTLTFWGTQSRASSIDHADRLAQGWKRAPSLFLLQLDFSLQHLAYSHWLTLGTGVWHLVTWLTLVILD